MKILDLSQTEFSLVLSMMLFTTDRARINNDEKSEYFAINHTVFILYHHAFIDDFLSFMISPDLNFIYFCFQYWLMMVTFKTKVRWLKNMNNLLKCSVKVLKTIPSEKNKITNIFLPRSLR